MEWTILLQANVYMLMLTFQPVPNWPNDGIIKLLFVAVNDQYNQFSFDILMSFSKTILSC